MSLRQSFSPYFESFSRFICRMISWVLKGTRYMSNVYITMNCKHYSFHQATNFKNTFYGKSVNHMLNFTAFLPYLITKTTGCALRAARATAARLADFIDSLFPQCTSTNYKKMFKINKHFIQDVKWTYLQLYRGKKQHILEAAISSFFKQANFKAPSEPKL